MPDIEIPTAEASPLAPFAADQDVRNVLGTIGNRLPAWVVISEFVDAAHATVLDRLSSTYPTSIPTFGGSGALVVRYAEAKLAAADILDAIRVNLPAETHDVPEQLRASALAVLSDGVVGYPAGSADVDTDGDPATPGTPGAAGPRVSSFTSASAFPDPYEALRGDGIRYL